MKWLPLAIITALTVGVLLMAGTAEARATRIPFTSEAFCTTTSWGTGTFSDGNLHIRGMTQVCDLSADIAQVDGTLYIVFNANLDATGSGPVWVTWRLETEGGGWEGVWHGTITGFLSAESYATGRGVGHGTGIYTAKASNTYTDDVSTPAVLATTGYILVP